MHASNINEIICSTFIRSAGRQAAIYYILRKSASTPVVYPADIQSLLDEFRQLAGGTHELRPGETIEMSELDSNSQSAVGEGTPDGVGNMHDMKMSDRNMRRLTDILRILEEEKVCGNTV